MQSRKALPMQFMRETHREKQMKEGSYQIIDMRKDMSIKYYSVFTSVHFTNVTGTKMESLCSLGFII